MTAHEHERPMMACGCVANSKCSHKGSVEYTPPVPSCVVHDCIEVAPWQPDLAGRVARCGCGQERPSAERDRLPFFESCDEGSWDAETCGECGFAPVAHEDINPLTRRPGVVADGTCAGYRPRGDRGSDRFYCGCRGWD